MDDPRTPQALRELAELYLSPRSAKPQADSDADPKPGSAASLRLTPADADAVTISPELIIAGHLPGPANLWINQYAQRLTTTFSTVAALHLTEDDIALDLFSQSPSLPGDGASLPEAINALSSVVGHWVLHLAHPADPFAQAVAHQTQQWTLLSGCDEAAIVAGYRLLKQLLDGRPGDQPQPQLGVMFLGCDQPDAQIALHRLARTAREHLRLNPAMIGCQQQMQPVSRKRLGHYPLEDWGPDSAELLATLTDLPIDAGSAAKPTPEPVADESSAPEPVAPEMPRQTEAPIPVASRVLLHAYLPSLHPLDARPPRWPHIELAVDDAGCLHLLGRDDPAADAILPQLIAAQSWAVEHRSLLALTAPDRPFADAAPVPHLFTERAKQFGPLAHAGTPDAPPFKLHLLLPVTVGDHTTHTSVELN